MPARNAEMRALVSRRFDLAEWQLGDNIFPVMIRPAVLSDLIDHASVLFDH